MIFLKDNISIKHPLWKLIWKSVYIYARLQFLLFNTAVLKSDKGVDQGYRNFEIQIGPLDQWRHRRHRNVHPTIPNSHEN